MTQNEMIEKAKRKMWQNGLSAKDVSNIPGTNYDLLVNGYARVKVGEQMPALMPKNCDVFAVVTEETITFLYKETGGFKKNNSFTRVFEK